MVIPRFVHTHFFDALIVVAIILTLSGVFWFRQSKKDEWVNVSIRIMNDEWWWPGTDPESWYSDGLKVGDVALNSFGKPIAKITQIDLADLGISKFKTTIHVELLVTHDTVKQLYLYNFQPLLVSKPIDLSFGEHGVKGIVTAINQPSEEKKYKKIDVKMVKIFPWVAESYKVGLFATNPQGLKTVEVLKLQVTPNVSRVFSDIRGEMISVLNQDYRDAYVTISVLSYKIGDVWYRTDGAQLKVGDKIWLHFPETTMKDAEILKVYPED